MPACPQKGRALQLAHYVKDKLYATTLASLVALLMRRLHQKLKIPSDLRLGVAVTLAS